MILDDIINERKHQLEREKALFSINGADSLKNIRKAACLINTPARDFKAALKKDGGVSVIAELKKASPSKGIIREDFVPVKIAAEYEKNGAAAISVLTEERYFMGHNDYLSSISEIVQLPVLRKDFIIEPFQIYHARILGASAVLLIAAALDLYTMTEFVKIAASLSLHVLAEAHNEEEAEKAMASGAGIIGINNRDLKTFKVDLAVTGRLIGMIGSEYVKVSESGIKTASDMKRLKAAGADAALIGETLMTDANGAGAGLKKLLEESLL